MRVPHGFKGAVVVVVVSNYKNFEVINYFMTCHDILIVVVVVVGFNVVVVVVVVVGFNVVVVGFKVVVVVAVVVVSNYEFYSN